MVRTRTASNAPNVYMEPSDFIGVSYQTPKTTTIGHYLKPESPLASTTIYPLTKKNLVA
jgi:hypothetical protein